MAAVTDAVEKHGLRMRPQDPGASDPSLAAFHVVEAPDDIDIEPIQHELLALEPVQAAYVKPPDALP